MKNISNKKTLDSRDNSPDENDNKNSENKVIQSTFKHFSYLPGDFIFYGAKIALSVETINGIRYLCCDSDSASPNFGGFSTTGLSKWDHNCIFEIFNPYIEVVSY